MAISSVAEQLNKQNETLVNINDGINKLSGSLGDFVLSQKRDKLDQLETIRDDKAKSGLFNRGSDGPSGSTFREGFTGGMGMGIGGAAFVAGGLAKKGLMRGLSSALIFAAADNAADYVTSQGGSQEVADSVQRSLEGASLGVLFGPKGALVGAIGGLVLSPENVESLKALGESISTRADQFKEYVKQFGIELPKFETVLGNITTGFGSLVNRMTDLVNGDFESAFSDFDRTAIMAAGGIAGVKASSNGKNAGKPKAPSTPAPKLSGAELDKQNIERTKNLSDKQVKKLEKDGFKVDKKTGALTNSKGQAISREARSKALNSVNAKLPKMPKAMKRFLGLTKKVPVLGTLLSAGSLISVLNDDTLGKREKTKRLAGVLGGIGGAKLGAIAGALGGSFFPGIGTLVGGISGGLLGAYFGDEIAQGLASYLMGDDKTSNVNGSDVTPNVDKSDPMGNLPPADLRTTTPTSGVNLQTQNAQAQELATKSINGGNTFINAPSNNTSVSGGGSGGTIPSSNNAFDVHDQMTLWGA